ncbi:MAG: hypothetical protein PHC35_08485 [Deltaproteobacteria bacterium]|nr:hypothetical protein [Deltaproteobacteria bacterium]
MGHETNAGCPRQEIELSQCIKTVKNNKHDETEGRNKHKGQAQGPAPTTEKGTTEKGQTHS